MKLAQVKYNLKFGNLPEGKCFIEYHKELNLSLDILGTYFTYIGNDIESFKGKRYLLVGLERIKRNSYSDLFDDDPIIRKVSLEHRKRITYTMALIEENPKIPPNSLISQSMISDSYKHVLYVALDTFKKEFKQIG